MKLLRLMMPEDVTPANDWDMRGCDKISNKVRTRTGWVLGRFPVAWNWKYGTFFRQPAGDFTVGIFTSGKCSLGLWLPVLNCVIHALSYQRQESLFVGPDRWALSAAGQCCPLITEQTANCLSCLSSLSHSYDRVKLAACLISKAACKV